MSIRMQVKSVELPGGPILEYVEQGRRGGVPVVLLHGITDSWRSFELLLPHLPDSLHAFALTQRGHGDSSRPASGYRLEDFAGDVAAFLDAMGIDSAVVVGHSMGTAVAQQLAIDHPGRVRALVLLGAMVALRHNAPVQELWTATISTLADPIDREFVLDFQRSTVAREIPPAYLQAVVDESLKVPARVWRDAFAGILAADLTPFLGKITAPTLLLWGDTDVLADESQQVAIGEGIAGAELRVYRGGGHAVHWETPERVAADIAAFVAALHEPA
jgi:pimeloyl-ACP methyl ester carboxylesterase